jgi:hypothetical protein
MQSSELSARHVVGAFLILASAALANGCGASIVVVECDDGLVMCDQDCVDLDLSDEHCGGCDRPCEEGGCLDGACRGGTEPCEGPGCDGVCDPGLAACGEDCVDLQNDSAHCGSCFAPCVGGLPCQAGRCGEACPCGRCDTVELPSQLDVTQTGSTSAANDRYASTCTGDGAPDIAHRYVAPITGQYVFDTSGSSFDTVLGILSGCSELACVDDTELGTAAYLSVFLEAGQEVIAIVDGFGASSGDYSLHVYQDTGGCVGNLADCDGICVDLSSNFSHCGGCNFGCAPDEFCQNFSCQCAAPGCGCEFPICGVCSFSGQIFDVPSTFSGSTEGLTNAIEPGCASGGSPEAVYDFFAPFDGTYVFDTYGSSYDTVLSIVDAGSCGEWACNDDWLGLDSRVEVALFAGQEVLVSVDGLGDAGAYELHVNTYTPAECGPVVDGEGIEIEGSTLGNPDTFTPICVPGGSGDTTFAFFASETRTYTFDSAGSGYDVVLSVLDGECGGVLLGCTDQSDQGSSDARLDIPLRAGQIVTVVIDGFGGDEGEFFVTIQ